VTDAPTSDVVVVIPAFRAASTLADALASVESQTIAPREVVVVLDGDDPEAERVASDWTQRLPLRAEVQAHAGPAAARRRALELSTAPLVALLDADDVWLPEHLASLVDVHRRLGGIVTADAFLWTGERTGTQTRRHRFPVPVPERQLVEILRENFVFIGSLFSRADYERAGGFRDGFTGAEDWDLWIRMIRAGAVVHAVPGPPTVRYRVAGHSLTRAPEVYDRYIAVLEAAAPACRTAEEGTVVSRRLRWLRARRRLARAYAAAGAGDPAAARREATGAFRGSVVIAAQAFCLFVAPRVAAALGRRLRSGRLG
jgi:glycosyltransferase involved in cell wall biosynthesis